MLWLKRFWPLLLGILYLVSPIDAIPDTLLGLGWTDDIVVLLLAYWFFKRVLPGGYRQTGSYHSPEEIKSAYRKKAQRYHPDRVVHLGDEFQQLAKQKFQEIQEAYEILLRD
jgi:uncharacterized membrane protein YkvA (DUF1232 family)